MPKTKPLTPPFAPGDRVEILVDRPEGAPLEKGQIVTVRSTRLIPNFFDPGFRPPKHVPKWIIKTDGLWEVTEDQCRKVDHTPCRVRAGEPPEFHSGRRNPGLCVPEQT